MSDIKANCGNCKYWDYKNKVNCASPSFTPWYLASCNFPIDWEKLPSSIGTQDRTHEVLEGCPVHEFRSCYH